MKPAPKQSQPVHYFCGTDDYLVEEAVLRLKESILIGPFADMNYQSFDAKTALASEIINAALTMPAFADRRLVIVKSAESLKDKAHEELAAYVLKPSESTVLVFVSNAAKPDMRLNFVKLLSEKGYITIKNKLGGAAIMERVQSAAKQLGKTITREAQIKLLASTGDRLRDVLGELEKIMLYASDKSEITATDVEEAGLDCREETVFALSDAIGAKDAALALKILDKLSDEEPPMLLGSIARQIRTLLLIKTLGRKGIAAGNIAAAVRVPPYYLDSYLKRAKNFTEAELTAAIVRLKKADTGIKTGIAPKGVVLPSLIFDLCRATGAK